MHFAQKARCKRNNMEVREALSLGQKALSGKNEGSSRDAVLLLSHALNCSPEDIYIHPERIVTPEEYDTYVSFLRRRVENEPIAYILGYKHFMGREFKVDRRVLIPRPETEILVESALYLIKGKTSPVICDICCGSGAVGLSIAKELEGGLCFLTDISSDALQVACENAKRLRLDQTGAVHFLQGDGLEPLRQKGLWGKVDIMVSNPPYIPHKEIANLSSEIKDFEPWLALDGGDDGTEFIRMLIKSAPCFLKPGGYLLIEIGYGQVDACVDAVFQSVERRSESSGVADGLEPQALLSPPHLLVKTEFYAPCESPWLKCWTICDYAGIERVFAAQKK